MRARHNILNKLLYAVRGNGQFRFRLISQKSLSKPWFVKEGGCLMTLLENVQKLEILSKRVQEVFALVTVKQTLTT